MAARSALLLLALLAAQQQAAGQTALTLTVAATPPAAPALAFGSTTMGVNMGAHTRASPLVPR
jgi:hypothetical protein